MEFLWNQNISKPQFQELRSDASTEVLIIGGGMAGEHSWDCPCHGSRFDEKGGSVDNPAKRDSHV